MKKSFHVDTSIQFVLEPIPKKKKNKKKKKKKPQAFLIPQRISLKLVKVANGLCVKVQDVNKLKKADHVLSKRLMIDAVKILQFGVDYWQAQAPETLDDESLYHVTECSMAQGTVYLLLSRLSIIMEKLALQDLVEAGCIPNLETYIDRLNTIPNKGEPNSWRLKASASFISAWKTSTKFTQLDCMMRLQQQRILNKFAQLHSMGNNITAFIQYANLAVAASNQITVVDNAYQTSFDIVFRQTTIQKTVADVQQLLMLESFAAARLVLQQRNQLGIQSNSLTFLEIVLNKYEGTLTNELLTELVARMDNMKGLHMLLVYDTTDGDVFSFVSSMITPVFVHRCSLINDIFYFIMEKSGHSSTMQDSMNRGLSKMYKQTLKRCLCLVCGKPVSWEHMCHHCAKNYCSLKCLEDDGKTEKHRAVCLQYQGLFAK